jgi:hypothetical protein
VTARLHLSFSSSCHHFFEILRGIQSDPPNALVDDDLDHKPRWLRLGPALATPEEETSVDNKIRLTFATTAGDYEDEFPANQPLHAVKKTVMAKLRLDPSQADDFVVTLNGNVLDEQKTLRDLGLADGIVLTLERKGVVKI